MKKIFIIMVSFGLAHIAFSQGTTVAKNDKQSALKGSLPAKASVDYLKNRGPAAHTKKAVTPASINTATTPMVGYSPPKVAATTQQTTVSNEQRVANLNARLAQNKAREDAQKANAGKSNPAQAGTTSTLKKSTGLKNPAALNKANSSNSTISTKQVTR